MAHVKNNILTEGISGKLGPMVFRNVNGKTVIAKREVRSEKEVSEAQRNVKRKFQLGAQYAKKVLQDPFVRESYAIRTKPGQSPYNVALADYMTAPEILEIDLTGFTGPKGSKIYCQVVDDHQVAEVKVTIFDPSGTLLEEGMATLDDNGIDWVYTTQKAITTLSGSSLKINASDIPGNTTERTEVVA